MFGRYPLPKQYPDVVTYTKTTGGGTTTNEKGQVVVIPPTTTEVSHTCRAEANTSSRYIITVDGAKLDYSWAIYMPLPAEAIPFDAKVVVTRNGAVRATGKVKRSFVDQINAKAYL